MFMHVILYFTCGQVKSYIKLYTIIVKVFISVNPITTLRLMMSDEAKKKQQPLRNSQAKLP